jgi:hypothetical protein
MSPRRILATLPCVVIALSVGGFVGTASAATPPPNDSINGATVIPSLPFVRTLDTTGATTDADDAQVNQSCGAPATNNSVWYKFTAAPGDKLLAVDTSGSTYSTGVIIATGTPGALTTHVCGPVTAQFAVVSGRTYYVLAFADFGSGGTLHISMHGAAPAPANDWFIHATAVPRLPYRATLNTTGATSGPADRPARASCGAPAVGNTVWYKFTAGPNETGIFVDASGSDYPAGVFIATGTPKAFTTVSCGPFFVTAKTTPGTTYYIMVFDFLGSGGGTLRLDIGDVPSVALTVRRRARIDNQHVVHLTGTYTCTGANQLHVSGNLVQIAGEKVATGHFNTLGVPAPICNGQPHSWEGLVIPDARAFNPGAVAAFTHANACGDAICTSVSETRVVTLVHDVSSSVFAPDTTLTTQTVRRSSGRSYGNALHAAAGWGR